MPPAPPQDVKLLRPKAATEVIAAAELEGDALTKHQPEHSPMELAQLLLQDEEEDYGSEAMQLAGHALERREAVWWALQCVKTVPELTAEEPAKEAIQAAENWFGDFEDNDRRIAFDKAQIVGLEEPAALPGTAAFFCEGSIAPVTVEQEVKPDEKAVFALASAAATLTAVAVDPKLAKDRYKAFLQLAQDVAEKKNRWPEKPTKPKPAVQPTPTATRPTVPNAPSGPPKPPPPPKKGYY